MENYSIAELDAIDRQILTILQQDSSLTNKALADKIELTSTPVYERVKSLERAGVIKNYVALLDRKKVDKQLMAICLIRLEKHTLEKLTAFEKHVKNIEEVIECYHLAGQYDYQLKVVVKDMNAFQKFVVKRLSTTENIVNVQSSFVLSSPKNSTAIPL